MEFQQSVGSGALGISFLVVENETDGITYGNRIEAVQSAVASYLHGSLEFAESRTIVGICFTAIDVIGGIFEIGIDSHRAYESNVAESSGRVGIDSGAVGAIVRFEAVRLRCIGNTGVAHAEAELYLARESVVGVELIVPTFVSDEVFGIDRTAEPLVRVVIAV